MRFLTYFFFKESFEVKRLEPRVADDVLGIVVVAQPLKGVLLKKLRKDEKECGWIPG